MSNALVSKRDRELAFMVRIACMYYNDGLTQKEIAEKLHVPRLKVNQSLQQARAEGIVRIEIVDPVSMSSDVASRLKVKFGLKHAAIAPVAGVDQSALLDELGRTAAMFLQSTLKTGWKVGLGWGTTIGSVVRQMTPSAALPVEVVPLTGALAESTVDFQANELARQFSTKLGGVWHALHAPAVVQKPETRAALLADTAIERTISLWKDLDAAVVGIGSSIAHSPMVRAGFLQASDIVEMDEAGAIADICMRFLNVSGHVIPLQLYERIISVQLSDLAKAKLIVGVAGGLEKITAIRSVLKGGHINALVTDLATAENLLKLSS